MHQEDAYEFVMHCIEELVVNLDAERMFTARVDEVICCDACGTPRPPNANIDHGVWTVINLSLPADDPAPSIRSCLDHHVSPTTVTVQCNHCDVYDSPSHKSFAWDSIGDVLLLRIMRELLEGAVEGEKDSRQIQVDQTLSITLGDGTVVRLTIIYP